jgi:hypothetical protein
MAPWEISGEEVVRSFRLKPLAVKGMSIGAEWRRFSSRSTCLHSWPILRDTK